MVQRTEQKLIQSENGNCFKKILYWMVTCEFVVSGSFYAKLHFIKSVVSFLIISFIILLCIYVLLFSCSTIPLLRMSLIYLIDWKLIAFAFSQISLHFTKHNPISSFLTNKLELRPPNRKIPGSILGQANWLIFINKNRR